MRPHQQEHVAHTRQSLGTLLFTEDFDPEDYLDDEDCFDEWESHQPSIGDEGWEDYYEERYEAISGLDLGAIDYSVEFPNELIEED